MGTFHAGQKPEPELLHATRPDVKAAEYAEYNEGQAWLPLLDYAVFNGISTSTLRRYIKAGKIPHKIEGGKYYILVKENNLDNVAKNNGQDLEHKLLTAHEQINELNMLVAIYEEKLAQYETRLAGTAH